MTRPFFLVRILGTPLVAAVICIACAAVLVGWYQGEFTWLAALLAAGLAFRTWRSVREVRNYKAWMREWNAIGGADKPAPPKIRKLSPVIGGALLILIIVPVYIGTTQNASGQTCLALAWCVALLYVVFTVIRRMVNRISARRKVAEAAKPVSWLVGPASSSPSRESITKALPEYTLRLLLGQGSNRP